MTIKNGIPNHIAIIMDGNGRWAESLGKPRTYGHRAGHTAVLKTVKHAAETGVNSLTLYAFSSENWQRPTKEVEGLMVLFNRAIKRNRRLFMNHNIRFNVIGDKTAFSKKLQQAITKLEDETISNIGMTLNIAANYGAKGEIIEACKLFAKRHAAGEISLDDICENSMREALSLADQADVDLMIRTGGELRISNYLLWQCAYAEFYFTDVFWPQFDKEELGKAITAYQQRTRRFGRAAEDNGELL